MKRMSQPMLSKFVNQFHTALKVHDVQALQPHPSSGLTGSGNKCIPIYLNHSSAHGRGSRAIVEITKQLFHKTYCQLSAKQKDLVLEAQRIEWTWENDQEKGRVFSTACTKVASGMNLDGTLMPCLNCQALLKDVRFQYVLKKPTPDNKKLQICQPLLLESYCWLTVCLCQGT